MDERKRASKEAPLGDVINKLMKAYQLDDKLKQLEVLAAWEEMMGRAVFLRTKNIYIKNKILFLQIDSSVMRDELRIGKNIIIQRVNDFAKCRMIEDVWFS